MPSVLRFGLQIPSFTIPGVAGDSLFERIAGVATAAESSGFDAVFVMDHLYQIRNVGQPDEPMLEAYTLLAGLAARTARVRLGTLVTGVTYRNPALLAKIVTTLDVVSAGRALLGIGAAWNDEEHDAFGFDFPTTRERMDRLEEALQICRAMFDGERPTFEGRHYRTNQVLNVPAPVNRIPILVGGGGEQRTLRLVARYADACNVFGDPATIRHKLDVLRQHCEREGRDPAEITKTSLRTLLVAPTAEEAERQGEVLRRARGVDEETYRSWAIVGDVAGVAAALRPYFEAGLDGMIVNLANVYEIGAVELAAQALQQAAA
jgi:F420-dependent oxidoreductase-like protein